MNTVYLSLWINIIVAGFWGVVLGFFPKWHFRLWPYGEDSPAARILAALYLSIVAFSILALIDASHRPLICLFLFAFQILYKVLTSVTVRNIKNPVVVSNLLIVIPHLFSLAWLWGHLTGAPR